MTVGRVRADRTIVVRTAKDKGRITLAAVILMTCKNHEGSHHFAVVGEGRAIQMSETGYQCLILHGFKIEEPPAA